MIRTLYNRILSCAVVAAALLFSAGAATTASAQVVQGTPIRGDTRLVQYQYDPDSTYLVLTKPKAVTHLQFAANEVIRSMAAGDQANFEITATKDRRNVFIKPRLEDIETSFTVITDQRVYQFVLRSTGEGKKWHQRVNWVYGSDLLLPLPEAEAQAESAPEKAAPAPTGAASAAGGSASGPAGLQPDKLRFNYEVTGDAAFRPSVVFDDGRFTYFKLPAGVQELPALFAITDGSDYTLVNYEVDGEYLVAQRLLPVAVLKLGHAEVRVAQKSEPQRTFLGFKLGN